MRAEAIHEQADRVRAEHAADVIERRHDGRLRQREAGSVQRRRQPVDREIDVQQAHEERDPEAQRRDAAAVLEEIGAPWLCRPRRSSDTIATSPSAPSSGLILRSSRFASAWRLRHSAAKRIDSGSEARERRREQQRQHAADDEHGAPAERLDELRRGHAGADRAERDAAADEHHDRARGACAARTPTRDRSRSATRCRARGP